MDVKEEGGERKGLRGRGGYWFDAVMQTPSFAGFVAQKGNTGLGLRGL